MLHYVSRKQIMTADKYKKIVHFKNSSSENVLYLLLLLSYASARVQVNFFPYFFSHKKGTETVMMMGIFYSNHGNEMFWKSQERHVYEFMNLGTANASNNGEQYKLERQCHSSGG
jgi:hypothetical protein